MNTDRPIPPAPYVNYWKGACLALVTTIVAILWYGTLPYNTFMGDDLSVLHTYKQGGMTARAIFFDVGSTKYRPFFLGVQYLELRLFGDNFNYYVYFNTAFEIVNSLLAGYLAWRISSKKWSMAVAATLVMVTARFSYYSVIQVNGVLEAMSLFFLLLATLGAYLALERSHWKYLLWANAAFFLLIFTHERYIVVSGFLMLVPFLFPNRVNLQKLTWRAAFCALPFLIVAFNYLFKTRVLSMPFFVGTGGTSIGMNYRQIASYMRDSLINMLGFNAGPNYLSGADYRLMGFWGMALGIAMTAGGVAMAAILLVEKYWKTLYRWKTLNSHVRAIILFSSLLLSLVLCASITIRVEHRWLYAPYAVFILAGAWIYGNIVIHRKIAQYVLAFITVSALGISWLHRPYVDNIFFCHCMRISDSVQSRIVDQYKHTAGDSAVYINHWGVLDVKNWVMMDDTYFKYFAPNADFTVQYVDSLATLPAGADLNNSLFFELHHNTVQDVTLPTRARFTKKPVDTTFDFLKNIEKGRINDEQVVATPSGKGVLTLHLADERGTHETFTIVSGFQYTFENIPLKNNATLSINAGIPYDMGDGALLFVELKSEGAKPERILSADLRPSHAGRIRWKNFELPLDSVSRPNTTITFGVESPSGNPTADWVALKVAQIVVPAAPEKK